ncbi:LON peptidase N-terminal domain and RING finger protein 3-like [Dendronephthya gigantea]|uniref:LON peptidase N-terminal domain and RING finger protein 3-like n=1 Tax=Dendronephthya gigantea TaxID=151771 RepID=UPI00106A891E|nr:LON peptidase N-terminal domain and RING finger protein 3-like [Dendronephthya gigantea]
MFSCHYIHETAYAMKRCNSLGSTQSPSTQQRRIDEAFKRYRKAFINGELDQQNLIINEIVSNLLSAEMSKLAEEQMAYGKQMKSLELEEIFTCNSCEEFLHLPVTLACGHTFCSDCLQNYQCQEKTFCPGCGQDSSVSYASNIILRELSVTWFPDKTYIQERASKARKMLRERRLSEFMQLVNGLITQYPENVNLLYLRARGYSSERNLSYALKDLDFACSLVPFDSKIFYARGEVLAALNENDEAMSMFLRAAALRPKNSAYRNAMSLHLEKLLREGMYTGSRFPVVQNFNIVQESTKLAQRSLATKSKPIFNESFTTEQIWSHRGQFRAENTVTNLSEITGQTLCNTHIPCRKMRGAVALAQTQRRQVTCIKENQSSPQEKSNSISSELECKLCFNILFDPVTTPCGHSLCRSCLQRCLDHRFECPCCRSNLQNYLEHLMKGKIGTCRVLERIIQLKFSEEYNRRKVLYQKELNEFSSCGKNNDEIPIFVCTLAVPGVAYPLHIFEPRYKLMIRRCLESGSRQFGMCVADPEHGFAATGTVLHISDVKFLPDGRSIIHTVGTKRFKVLERGMKDGYNTAKVEWLQDEIDETDYTELNFQVYDMMSRWIKNLPSEQQTCIEKAVGQMPEVSQSTANHGPNWLWWLLAVMPLNTEAKQIILSMNSVTERLYSTKRFLAILLNRL